MALGAVEKARRLARRNVLILAEAVRQGYQIVTTEPSAALCISQEYPNLVDDEDARLVADNTFDACDYLWKLHQKGKLELDFKPMNAVVGITCRAMSERWERNTGRESAETDSWTDGKTPRQRVLGNGRHVRTASSEFS